MKEFRLPTYYVNHGGGPWPYMEGSFRSLFDELEHSLVRIRAELADAPTAVLIVLGHWEGRIQPVVATPLIKVFMGRPLAT